MKKVGFILALLTIVACKQDKIGYVDNVKIMEDYQEKKDIEAVYTKKSEAFNKKRDSISQAFQIQAQAFQQRAQKMAQQKAQEEAAMLQQQGQFMGQQLQQEEQALQLEGQTEMDSLVSRVKRHIENYGKANGYTYILGGGDGGSVLYGDDTKNITEAVLKELNDKYKQK